ncbi:MAG TPA: DsrE family protein [Saprospiraceae bacterium]|nr:DsrE family protein [Saprospiraceae bacterium]
MRTLFFFFGLAFTLQVAAQNHPVDKQKHKIVFQLTSSDSLVHKATLRQIGHILEAAPSSKIEVVCHSNGLPFLVAAQSTQVAKIKELEAKGVDFMACENTMRDRKVNAADLISGCQTVPSGVLEVIRKQEKHWAYIKAGF